MSTAICPNCNAALPPQEVAEGWCETCGKKIPAWVRGDLPVPPSTPYRPSLGGGRDYSSLTYRPLASRFARLVAATIDVLLTWLAFGLGVVVANALWPENDPAREDVGGWLAILGMGVFALVQFVLLSASGQTVGKKVMRIRIVRMDDEANPGFVGAVLLRAVVPGLIGGIPCLGAIFGIANVMYIFGDDRRCLHDHIAGTKVVVA